MEEVVSRLRSYYRHTTANPQWTLMFLLSRFAFLRSAIKSLSKTVEISAYQLNQSVFQGVDINAIVASLERDGYCLGLKLPENLINEITGFATSTDCYGNSNSSYGFTYPQKQQAQAKSGVVFHSASFYNVKRLCPAIEKLSGDLVLLAIAARFMKSHPICVNARLWWTFKTAETDYDSSKMAGFFHIDTDDYRALRVFFYLTNVDANSGPHIVVRGSHIRKNLFQIASLSQRKDQAIIDSYGAENVIAVCGEAGYGFVEDPFCFHKGTRPHQRDRLMLELRFATKDYGVLRSSAAPALFKNIFES